MVQGRGRARLLCEALQPLRIAGERRGENLDGDIAIQPGIAGAVNLAHAARAQRRLNFIRAEFHARRQGHVWGEL